MKSNEVSIKSENNYQSQPFQYTKRRLIKLESFNHIINNLPTSSNQHNNQKKKNKLPIMELSDMFSYLKKFRSFKLKSFRMSSDCSQDIKISLRIRITNDSVYQIF